MHLYRKRSFCKARGGYILVVIYISWAIMYVCRLNWKYSCCEFCVRCRRNTTNKLAEGKVTLLFKYFQDLILSYLSLFKVTVTATNNEWIGCTKEDWICTNTNMFNIWMSQWPRCSFGFTKAYRKKKIFQRKNYRSTFHQNFCVLFTKRVLLKIVKLNICV